MSHHVVNALLALADKELAKSITKVLSNKKQAGQNECFSIVPNNCLTSVSPTQTFTAWVPQANPYEPRLLGPVGLVFGEESGVAQQQTVSSTEDVAAANPILQQ